MLIAPGSNTPLRRSSSIRGTNVKTPLETTPAPPRDAVSIQSKTASEPRTSVPEVKVQFEAPDMGDRLLNWFSSLTRGKFKAELARINKAEAKASELKTPEQFQAQTLRFKERLANGESLESLRVEAYAVARQAAVVATGMRPYDCQMLGALAMDDGNIAEMMTGEGKTLTAVMPLYLNALAGKGAHLVTVNDTLAQRDRELMGPIFETMGLSVGCVLEDMTPEEKRAGYGCDVTYTTDRSLGFDYLRDRLVYRREDRVQRAPFFALVDEVDQVLLDEARTPLIISGAAEAADQDFQSFDKIVRQLRPGTDYFVDREKNSAWLSEIGLDFVENELHYQTLDFKDPQAVVDYNKRRAAIRTEGQAWRALHEHQQDQPGFFAGLVDSQWKEKNKELKSELTEAESQSDALGQPYHLYSEENAEKVRVLQATLKAHALFEEGVDYLVQDHEVKIVDENKGRTSKGRRFNEGLPQPLEAKSRVPMKPEPRPVATITYPTFFAQYPRLAGMSGTAKSSEGEFQELYDMSVVKVPTNLQFQLRPDSPKEARRHNRIDEVDAVFTSKQEKFEAVVERALEAYEEGIPVLVGTLSVEANEYLYASLLEKGIARGAVQVLNAEHVRGDKSLENSIIADAGRSGMITVATNMAGRGVNIKPDLVNYKKLALEVEKLAGEQGKPVVIDLASEKEAERLGQWLEGAYPYRIGEGEVQAGETLIRVASEKPAPAGAATLKGEDFPTGGLFVIGSERAKSRRIDDQLIGRAARQGAPGRSKFYLSLEDELFHDFGGRALKPTLELLGGKKGRVESDLVEGMVESVQNRVGQLHFESRDNTTKYDEVLNKQRETYYAIRDEILDPEAPLREKLTLDAQDVVKGMLEEALPKGKHKPEAVRAALAEISETLKLDLRWDQEGSARTAEVVKSLDDQVYHQLEQAYSSFDKSDANLDQVYRRELLTMCDFAWSEHLELMGLMKESVQWVSTVGEKPEDAYRRRGYESFETMISNIAKGSVKQNVPQIMVGARVLETDRKQASQS